MFSIMISNRQQERSSFVPRPSHPSVCHLQY